MRHTVSTRSVLLALLALIGTLLTTTVAVAAPDADLGSSGFATVSEGETTRGTVEIDLTDTGGLGVDHPLAVQFLVENDGDPVQGVRLRVSSPGAATTQIVTDADGLADTRTTPLRYRGTPRMSVTVSAVLPVGTNTITAQLLDITDPVTRIQGSDRFATAAAVSAATQGDGADTVYVATGENFIDALSGGAGAARDDAPLLLVTRDSIPDLTFLELTRLDPDRIVVMGGEVPVSQAVVDDLARTTGAEVVRRAGATRYGTAVAVSRESWAGGADTVVLANGTAFPDAVSGGGLAARLDAPVLLTAPTSLPGETAAELRRLDPDTILVMGGTTVVPNSVFDAVRALGVGTVRRIAGETRYDTALAATVAGADAPGLPPRPIGFLATGENFPDALAAVAAVGATGGELMLSPQAATDDPTDQWVDARDPWRVALLGGPVALAEAIRTDFDDRIDPFAFIVARRIGDAVTARAIVTPAPTTSPTASPSPTSSPTATATPTESETPTESDPSTPDVDITSPTATAPANATAGDSVDVTFTTDIAGDYTVFLQIDGAVVGNGEPAATGTATEGANSATFNAPSAASYDVVVRVLSDEERSGQDLEDDALIVAADPTVPTVDITSPTGDDPAMVGSGDSFDVVFSVSTGGSYEVQYTVSGGATYTTFGGEGTGTTLIAGEQTATVSAPTTDGNPVYDIRVEFTEAGIGGQTVSDVEEQALIITGGRALGRSRQCQLGREDPDQPNEVGQGGDPLDPAHCLLPFPSNFHTVPVATDDDPTTELDDDNNLRINFAPTAMPRNREGKLVDPTEWNRNDGFSPGSMVMTVVPGLDLANTWDPGNVGAFRDLIETPARSLADDAPMVIVNADTGERHPFWAELDTHPTTLSGGWEQTLILRPLVHFEEGERYLVGLRNLKDDDGAAIPAGDAFTFYRDEDATNPFPEDMAFTDRRGEVQGIIAGLEAKTNFDRATDDIFLAWDFTVASEANLAGRLLTIRDDAFADLGDETLADGVIDGDAPPITITDVEQAGEGSDKLVTITGEITIPLYLRSPQSPDSTLPDFVGCGALPDPLDDACGLQQAVPGARFFYEPGAEVPSRNPITDTMQAEYVCNIPVTALQGGVVNPSRVALYGHGLLGGKGESKGSSSGRMRADHNQTHCALDWFGFATEDIGNVAAVLTDYSNFPSIGDRVQQGFLNWQFLARAVVHPDGLINAQDGDGNYPFRQGGVADGTPFIQTDEVVYEGNSQGGILGGGLLAIAPDVRKGTFGVPATNYSTLLNRSVDFEGAFVGGDEFPEPFQDVPSGLGYGDVYYNSYPDKVDQQVGFNLLQMLWDRAEGNGFAAHTTTDTYPDTPTHQVLLHPAWGDYQVANIAAEVQARTYGAAFLDHSLEDGLHWSDDPLFMFDSLEDNPDSHSALVYWDSGNPKPPNGNVPPIDVDQDPHSDPRKDPNSGRQRDLFYETGRIMDVLPGQPYHTDRFPERGPR